MTMLTAIHDTAIIDNIEGKGIKSTIFDFKPSTNHFLGTEVEDDEGEPDDASGVHGKTDELGFVEVFGQIARLERVQRTHGDQQKIDTERDEHSHVRVLATSQLSDVHGRVDLHCIGDGIDDSRRCHHRGLGCDDDSSYYHLQKHRMALRVVSRTCSFLSRVSTRYSYSNSVCLSVCLSVRHFPVSYRKGLTYPQNFFTAR